MQGVADGHKAVIGHRCQQKNVQHNKEYKEMHLCDAGFIGNCLSLGLYVHQHSWDDGGG
jgi:hypothetical protein